VPVEITRWRRENGDGLDNYVLLQTFLAKRLDEAGAAAAAAEAAGGPKGGGGPESVEGLSGEAIARIDSILAQVRHIGGEFKLS
jgi:hypothetical protein